MAGSSALKKACHSLSASQEELGERSALQRGLKNKEKKRERERERERRGPFFCAAEPFQDGC